MSSHDSRLDDLADAVLQNIHDREALIERLEKVHTKDAQDVVFVSRSYCMEFTMHLWALSRQ
jgi:hypothetical protein